MSPDFERLYDELPYDERREFCTWLRMANAAELKRFDELVALWYEHKDEAAQFKKDMEALVERKFS